MAESILSLSSSGEGAAEIDSSSLTEGPASEDGAPFVLHAALTPLGASCNWESGVGRTLGERGGVSVTETSGSNGAEPSCRPTAGCALTLSTTCDFELESAAGDGGDTRWDATDGWTFDDGRG
jgi:hypothetical protein